MFDLLHVGGPSHLNVVREEGGAGYVHLQLGFGFINRKVRPISLQNPLAI